MISVSKEEAARIRKAFPDVRITRTMKQSSNRGHWYAPEERRVLELVKDTNFEAQQILKLN